jgi:flagellin-like hook-associated protein FlgL
LASANAFVASGGGSTTGSYVRDVMRALATLGSLTSAQEGAGGFHELVADTRESLRGAISALNGDAGVLGDTRAHLARVKLRLDVEATALTGQVSDAEDVDMAATLSRLSLVQAQLQSSYQMIAGMQSLSLARFLSG